MAHKQIKFFFQPLLLSVFVDSRRRRAPLLLRETGGEIFHAWNIVVIIRLWEKGAYWHVNMAAAPTPTTVIIQKKVQFHGIAF